MPDDKPTHVPWPIWALVTILVAVIPLAYDVIKDRRKPAPTPTPDSRSEDRVPQQRRPQAPDLTGQNGNSTIPLPESSKLVGTWQTVETMNGLQVTITVHARPDGSMTQLFAGPGGTEQQDCSWRFSDGVLFVRYGDGASGKGSIDWIDNNQFVLTIIDNGVPAYTGVKRRYRRL